MNTIITQESIANGEVNPDFVKLVVVCLALANNDSSKLCDGGAAAITSVGKHLKQFKKASVEDRESLLAQWAEIIHAAYQRLGLEGQQLLILLSSVQKEVKANQPVLLEGEVDHE